VLLHPSEASEPRSCGSSWPSTVLNEICSSDMRCCSGQAAPHPGDTRTEAEQETAHVQAQIWLQGRPHCSAPPPVTAQWMAGSRSASRLLMPAWVPGALAGANHICTQ
jgi:hypothetical protein